MRKYAKGASFHLLPYSFTQKFYRILFVICRIYFRKLYAKVGVSVQLVQLGALWTPVNQIWLILTADIWSVTQHILLGLQSQLLNLADKPETYILSYYKFSVCTCIQSLCGIYLAQEQMLTRSHCPLKVCFYLF